MKAILPLLLSIGTFASSALAGKFEELQEIAESLREEGKLSGESDALLSSVVMTEKQISEIDRKLMKIESMLASLETDKQEVEYKQLKSGWIPDFSPTDFEGNKGPPPAPIGKVDPLAIWKRTAKANVEEMKKEAERAARKEQAGSDESDEEATPHWRAKELLDIWETEASLIHTCKMLAKKKALKEKAISRIGPLARAHFYKCEVMDRAIPVGSKLDEFGFYEDQRINVTNDYAGDLEDEEWERWRMSDPDIKSLKVDLHSRSADDVCKNLAKLGVRVFKVSWHPTLINEYDPAESEFCQLQGCHSFVEGKQTGFVLHPIHYILDNFCSKRALGNLQPNLQGQRIIGKQVAFQFELCELYEAPVLVVELPYEPPNGVHRKVYISQYKRFAQVFGEAKIKKVVIAFP